MINKDLLFPFLNSSILAVYIFVYVLYMGNYRFLTCSSNISICYVIILATLLQIIGWIVYGYQSKKNYKKSINVLGWMSYVSFVLLWFFIFNKLRMRHVTNTVVIINRN